MQFSSDLDEETRRRLRHGERIVEILKQAQYKPISTENEILTLFAVQHGCMEDIPIEDIQDFAYRMIEHFTLWHADIIDEVKRLSDLAPDLEAKLLDTINQFKASYTS